MLQIEFSRCALLAIDASFEAHNIAFNHVTEEQKLCAGFKRPAVRSTNQLCASFASVISDACQKGMG